MFLVHDPFIRVTTMRRFHRIRPPNVGDYTAFIAVGFVFGLVAAVSFVLYQESGSSYAAAVCLACSIGLMFTYIQKRAFDRHVWLAATPIEIDDTPTDPEPLQQVNNVINSGRHVRWGIWLTADEWQKIAAATLRNDNKISRALCMKEGVKGYHLSEQGKFIGWFDRGEKEATGWGDFVYWLVGQGVLHAAAPNQANKLTEVGIAQFEELATPQPVD